MQLPTKRRKTAVDYILICLGVVLIVGGVYLLATVASPFLSSQIIDPVNNDTTRKLAETPEERITENRIYIPKINVNVSYEAGTAAALERGAWWRAPQNGNPKDGGNFVIAAHRFQIGPTPHHTINNSPFYNIDRMQVGDEITVDYEGKRYEYVIGEIKRVDPNAIEIEQRTSQPRLTIYTCTLGGSFDGREVLFAIPKQKQ